MRRTPTTTAFRIPILGISAPSGTGKTTLLKKLIPILRQRGVRVAVVKHTHHDFDVDKPGKDSYELRKAGAAQTLIASRHRWALITEEEDVTEEPRLEDLVRRLDHEALDLVLVEGFHDAPIPRIAVRRNGSPWPPSRAGLGTLIAVTTDRPTGIPPTLPTLDLDDPDQIATFIEHQLLTPRTPGLESVAPLALAPPLAPSASSRRSARKTLGEATRSVHRHGP